MSGSRYDVAIVGLGPVGACAALLLAEAGRRVAILERDLEPVSLPRAVGIDGESLRQFQRIGHGATVDAILQPARSNNEVWFTTSRREKIFDMQIVDCGPNGWRDLAFFDQPELEHLLRELVGKVDTIDVFIGHEVNGIDQSADEVVVDATSASGESTSVQASYLLGCDGASSFVRGCVGIPWQSLGYDHEWLVVDITVHPEAEVPDETMQVCDPERLATYVAAKDPNRRWEFALRADETRDEMLRPERIEELLRPWLVPDHYDVRRSAVYQFHAATAQRWRAGRVFLAGDAAHQMPPFLGQGLNSGFRDAANIAWKLALVLAKRCDPALLDSYEAERSAHARDVVDRAVFTGRLMETLAAREAGLPDPHPSIDAEVARMLGDGIVPGLRTGVLVNDQIEAGHGIGALFCQPIVRRAGGAPTRLDELLGRGVAVVGRTAADLEMGPEARAILDHLGGRALSLEDVEPTAGRLDRLLVNHPAAVVRPDRYVFGVVDGALDLDRLLVELGRKLAINADAA